MKKLKNLITAVSFSAASLLAANASAARWDWDLCYDTTTSVPPKQYNQYANLAQKSVLEFLQPGDKLSILRVDETDVAPIQMESRLSLFEAQLEKIYQQLKEMPQNKRSDTVSDFTTVFNHARERIELNEKANRAKATKYMLVCVTDGEQDNKRKPAQSANSSGAVAADYRILFVGIRKGMETNLIKLAGEAGFTDQKKILLVPFEHAHQIDIASFLGRGRRPVHDKMLGKALAH